MTVIKLKYHEDDGYIVVRTFIGKHPKLLQLTGTNRFKQEEWQIWLRWLKLAAQIVPDPDLTLYVINNDDRCPFVRFDHASPPHGPQCVLERDHGGDCDHGAYNK